MPCQRKHPPPIRALLIDISGTLLVGSSAIPGAAQALSALRAAHIPFRLCSNTSKESSDAVFERMREAGLDVRREEVWTSIGALKAVLKELRVKRPYMLLSRSALEECTDNTETGDDLPTGGDPSSSSPHHDAVVVGLAPALLDYEHLNTAFRILVSENRPPAAQTDPDPSSTSKSKSKGKAKSKSRCDSITDVVQSQHRPPLIALHKVRYFEASDHALSLGPGPFVLALEDAARTSAIVVGKPTRAFFEAVLDDLQRDLGEDVASGPLDSTHDRDHGHRHECGSKRSPHARSHRWEGIAVVGDDVHVDLGEGAIELGLWRVLVKTGKYRPGDERPQDIRPPDQVCASFAEFIETLLEQHSSSC